MAEPAVGAALAEPAVGEDAEATAWWVDVVAEAAPEAMAEPAAKEEMQATEGACSFPALPSSGAQSTCGVASAETEVKAGREAQVGLVAPGGPAPSAPDQPARPERTDNKAMEATARVNMAACIVDMPWRPNAR